MHAQINIFGNHIENSKNFLQSNDLEDKIVHPIFYFYDFGKYSLEALIEKKIFNTNTAQVEIIDNGIIKIGNKKICKIFIKYNQKKKFQNAYLHNEKLNEELEFREEVNAYSYENKIFFQSSSKTTKNIIKCIKESRRETTTIPEKVSLKIFNKSYLIPIYVKIQFFMEYLSNIHEASTNIIYANQINKMGTDACAIYGTDAEKGDLYKYVKTQGGKLSCIVSHLKLSCCEHKKHVLFTENCGILIKGNHSEETILEQIIECIDIIERFLNNGINN